MHAMILNTPVNIAYSTHTGIAYDFCYGMCACVCWFYHCNCVSVRPCLCQCAYMYVWVFVYACHWYSHAGFKHIQTKRIHAHACMRVWCWNVMFSSKPIQLHLSVAMRGLGRHIDTMTQSIHYTKFYVCTNLNVFVCACEWADWQL